MNNQQYMDYLKSDKWKKIAQKRMEIDHYRCTCCGCMGTQSNKLEVHHLSYKYIYEEEKRVYQDLVTLCHRCHKGLHNIMNRVTDESGRRGWRDNTHIPDIHVFTLSGDDAYSIERWDQ